MLIKDLSKLCFGCWQLGGHNWGKFNYSESKAAVRKSLDFGINFFDTAAIYGLGLSEKRLSNYLGNKINNIYISTKCGLQFKKKKNKVKIIVNNDPEFLRQELENSLRRLKVDKIFLYSLHYLDKKLDFRYTLDVLQKFKEEGKIQNIGCSNIDPANLKNFLKVCNINYIQIPINIIDMSHYNKFKKICIKSGVNILPYNVLAYGFLTGKIDINYKFGPNDHRSKLDFFRKNNLKRNINFLNKIKKEISLSGQTLLSHSIKSIVSLPGVKSTIVGIQSLEQLKENTACV
jgi:aryl-alcohol dehydrogenase-like predicted oxidoreductase